MNNAINHNGLPRVWKLSTVVFINKDKSKKGAIGNYRPISLLCNLSKVLKMFFVDRLEEEIEARDLISGNQFGFRKRQRSYDPCCGEADPDDSYVLKQRTDGCGNLH